MFRMCFSYVPYHGKLDAVEAVLDFVQAVVKEVW